MGDEHASVYRVEGFTCANCAGKFEKNVKGLPGVKDAKVNFGASKLTVYGEATTEELEEAGAFEQLKVMQEPSRRQPLQYKQVPFYKKHRSILLSFLLLVFGYVFQFKYGESNIGTVGLFLTAILVGGFPLLKTGIRNVAQLEFDMKTLMTVAVIGGAIIGEWGKSQSL